MWPLSSQDPYLEGAHFTRLLAPQSLSPLCMSLALSTHIYRTFGEPSHTTSVEQSGPLVIVHLQGGTSTPDYFSVANTGHGYRPVSIHLFSSRLPVL